MARVNELVVKNAKGEPNTRATIIHTNRINYKPMVSVVISVYNTEEYLRQCLDSVVNQTLKEIEIICVDDGSTDSSLEILREYAQKDNRFTIITQTNLHAGVARNAGLTIASGEYIYFLDSDDYLDLQALKKVYEKIVDANADICVFKNRMYRQVKEETVSCIWEHLLVNIPSKAPFSKFDNPSCFFQFCNVPAWLKMYKTSFVKNNKIKFQNLRTCNDTYFHHVTLALANSIIFLNEELITWRVGHSCTTATRGKYIYCVLKAFKAVKNRLNKKDFALLSDTFYKAVKNSFDYELKQVQDPELKNYWTLKLYKFLPRNYWTQKAIELNKKEREKRFSVKNVGVHKVICIAGLKIKIKSKKLVDRERYRTLEKRLVNMVQEIENIKNLINVRNMVNNGK